ncbi:hypothetical protein ZWY2020_056172 [Hordeum vulgare]|nr:hypothetical protein ZWY2020_056172 [Hordeum vulgare]
MDRLPLCDPARRPRERNKVIMASPTLEIKEHILRQHAITLTATDRSHSTMLAAVGRGKDADVVKNAHRRRSRTSVTGGRGRSQAGKDVGALVLRGLVPTPQVEEDPVAQFFSFSGTDRALSPPPRTDCMQLEMENAILEALDTPLDFEDGGRSSPRLDARPVELESSKMLPCLLLCISSPAAATISFQMEVVTQRVGTIQIGSRRKHAAELFAVAAPLVLPRN